MIALGGGIVAVALYPIFAKVSSAIGDRRKLSALLISMALVGVIVIPAILLTGSLADGVHAIVEAGEAEEISLPDPPSRVAEIPLIGPSLYSYWQKIADNPPAVIRELRPLLKTVGSWLLSLLTGAGFGLLRFLVCFCIAGVFLASADSSEEAWKALAFRLAGDHCSEWTELIVTTIRSVATGILAVALVQTACLTVGFVLMGFPWVGLLALVVLILCVIQIGPSLVSIPAILYVCSTNDLLPATIFTIWTVVMTFIDGPLKPIIFGRGATVPILVIFLGAIGGMISYGIIGLFLGAVVLSVGYKLYEAWITEAVDGGNTSELVS